MLLTETFHELNKNAYAVEHSCTIKWEIENLSINM
jgi:hypothetical protein